MSKEVSTRICLRKCLSFFQRWGGERDEGELVAVSLLHGPEPAPVRAGLRGTHSRSESTHCTLILSTIIILHMYKGQRVKSVYFDLYEQRSQFTKSLLAGILTNRNQEHTVMTTVVCRSSSLLPAHAGWGPANPPPPRPPPSQLPHLWPRARRPLLPALLGLLVAPLPHLPLQSSTSAGRRGRRQSL